MKINSMLLLAGGLGLGGVALVASSASAMPKNGLVAAPAMETEFGHGVEIARWICGPYGGCGGATGAPYWGWGPPRSHWTPYLCYRPWWWRRHDYYW